MENLIARHSFLRVTPVKKEWIIFTIRIICIFLFLFSGYEKLVTHAQFLKGLEKVAIVGKFAPIISWLVPISELVIGILMALTKTQKLGLYAFASLMALFTLYIGGVIIWTEQLPCHCNILVQQLSFPQHIIFNAAFIALALFAIRLMNKK